MSITSPVTAVVWGDGYHKCCMTAKDMVFGDVQPHHQNRTGDIEVQSIIVRFPTAEILAGEPVLSICSFQMPLSL